jgi:hypothetical protein
MDARVKPYDIHTSLSDLFLRVASDSLAGRFGGRETMTEISLGRFGDRRLEKGGRYCIQPSFVGLVRGFGGLPGTGHERFGSRVFCATRR